MSKNTHSPYKNKVAVAIVKNTDGQVLIVKRKYEVDSIDGGRLSWTFPSDIVPEGEDFAEAAKKHTLEQTGYTVEVKSKISQRTYHPFKNYLEYFECEISSEDKHDPISAGIETHMWVSPGELNNYFTTNIDPGVVKFLGL